MILLKKSYQKSITKKKKKRAKNRQFYGIRKIKENKKGIKKGIKIKRTAKRRHKKSLKIGNLLIYWCGL